MKNKFLKLISLVLIAFSFGSPILSYASYGNLNLVAGTGVVIDNADAGNPVISATQATQNGKYLISGGAAWSGTGYVYNVSALQYYINGNYTSAPTVITLPAADPTYDEIDAITADNTGTVGYVQGTPSANPIEPDISSDAIAVQYVLVEHGTTAPTVTQETIYDEPPSGGWTGSTVILSGSPTGTTNFSATNSCFHGTYCVDNFRDGRVANVFTRSTPISLAPFVTMSIYVRLGTSTAGAYNAKSLIANFQSASSANLGTAVNLFSYGIQKTVIGTWQLAVIPISVFGHITTNPEKLRLYMAGGTAGSNVEWDEDYIQMSSGTAPLTSVPTITVQQDGTNIGTQSVINEVNTYGSSIPLSATNDPLNGRVNITAGNANFHFDPSTDYFYTGENSSTSYFIVSPQTNAIQAGAGSWQFFGNSTGEWLQVTDGGSSISGLVGDITNSTDITFSGSSHLIGISGTHIQISGLQTFANNAAALAGSLNVGDAYLVNDVVTGSKALEFVQ